MVRLQKLLAAAGFGSRRAIEAWIRAGRVTVAGRVAQLGDRASASDEVRLDGVELELKRFSSLRVPEVLLYYRPVGEVTTRRDPQRRPTVFERLPAPAVGRWIAVGRLDVNTAGLLLFTTDGELAHRLMHPSTEIEREYLVRLRGRPGATVLRQLTDGVALADGPARFDRIVGDDSSLRVVLHEGRNREVRRLFEAVGFEVSRLLRVRYGPIELPRDLRPGGTRLASTEAVEQLGRMAAPKAQPGGPP